MDNPAPVPASVPAPVPAPAVPAAPVVPISCWGLPPPELPPVTAFDVVAWIAVVLSVGFILHNKLLSALLSGLFVYSLVRRITSRLTVLKMSGHRAKVVAVLIMSLALTGLAAGVVILLISVIRGHIGHIPEMMDKMKEIVDQFRVWLTSKGVGEYVPNADKLREFVSNSLKEHSTELKQNVWHSGLLLVHALIGIVIGAMLSFHSFETHGPLSAALVERVRRFARAFQQVFFAQVKISALNTVFTGVYLLLVLPRFDVKLPFAPELVLVTFIAGLLPVVGNLISNGVIVLISFGVGWQVAAGSFIFLVVIHKLEYFLNAKIVGGEIHAAAWEILLAMVCFEAVFGIPGLIMAPIFYAYAKAELKDRQLI